ncbi:LacI family DNA-binding transcriptional regulator [Rhodoferax sp. OV413]|uniref:LacI family DNA-binding transcriptional regulator n=1 Tax=Rhodoferax sp. OV413 TaxID=1855285 RepID=UPI000B8684D5|nr:LacI family DNA-binding transcriptional regulator [Rhodoferax sp. OV413]
MNYRPTMHDVARLAGVSIKTVSRVVNNEPRVNPETGAKVSKAIQELGFRRNEQARSLRPGQASGLLGLVTSDMSNPFYSAIACGIEEVAQQRGYFVLTASSEEDASREQRLIESLLQHNIDGLMIVPAVGDHQYLSPTLLRDVPAVALDRPGHAQMDSVLLDNREGALQAVTALIGEGHRRIAMIDGYPQVYTGAERIAGYAAALRQHQIEQVPDLIMTGHHGELQAEAAMDRLFRLGDPPTAVFTTNNRITLGVLRAMKRWNRWLAVASFDDFELADMLHIPILVVRYNAVEMGRKAAELLFHRLEDPQTTARTCYVPVEVVIRGG